MNPRPSPLGRFKVIDLSRVRAGPTATRQLADWGADVIGIEQPLTLNSNDPHVGPRSGSDFRNLNRNRRSITLNLKSPKGIEILKQLVAGADVLVENFRPDVKERLGIGYEVMARVNPRLVYASISGFGQDGPYSNRPGFDQIAQGMSGLMSVTGTPETGPLRTGIAVGDLCAGVFCAQGILTALLEREVSGKGQWVQTSLVQALAFMLDFQAARYLMDGTVPQQEGNEHPTIAPVGTFKTRDGHINLAVVGPEAWERFCGALQRLDWMRDERFSTSAARARNKDLLRLEIEPCLHEQASEHWVRHFNEKGIACGPVYRIDELFNDPNLSTLPLVDTVAQDKSGIRYLAQPMTLSRTPSAVHSHPPALGEHTQAVLSELGLTEAEISALESEGVI